jgi:PiT family inorganic phosphate transporter
LTAGSVTDHPWKLSLKIMAAIYVLIFLALVFNFLDGFNDSSNIVATVISSRAMPPRQALFLVAVAEFCGPFLFGIAVASTIGKSLIAPSAASLAVLVAAMGAACAWDIFVSLAGIPSSSSHALVGGMIGATVIASGFQALLLPGLLKVAIALFISPVIGLVMGYVFTRLVFYLARNASMKANWFFRRMQFITALCLGLSHGANDAPKSMGVIALGLLSMGYLSYFQVPLWVIVIGAGAVALGTSIGGWRTIKTLGIGIFKVKPVHGFCTQAASAIVILAAALLGGPVSSTQVIGSTLLGVGSAERVNMIRWNVAGQIAIAWLLTIPASAAIAAMLYLIVHNLL